MTETRAAAAAAEHVHDGEGPDVDPATGDEAETFQPVEAHA